MLTFVGIVENRAATLSFAPFFPLLGVMMNSPRVKESGKCLKVLGPPNGLRH